MNTQDPLEGMTQARWDSLSGTERDRLRAKPYPEQLRPYLGSRVEVVTHDGETRRFWVGVSTGWRPCYLEVHTARSHGGSAAERDGYKSVRVVRQGPRR